jgi:hypothetical protein
MQTATANTPRWDYDPVTHALSGLLIEEARTNLLLNSATLGTQTVTVAAVAYTLSFYGTGSITLSGVSTAGPLTGTGAFPQRVSLNFTPTAGSLTLTVTGTVQNAQLETGNFPVASSWISTAGATAQRTADVALYAAAPLDPNTGTLVADVYLRQLIAATNNIDFAMLDTGATTDIMGVRQATAGMTGTAIVFVANVNLLTITTAALALGPNKVGMTYSRGTPNAVTLAANGGAIINGAPSNLPTPTRITFGTGRNFALNSWLQRVRYWNTVLSNAALQAVTT